MLIILWSIKSPEWQKYRRKINNFLNELSAVLFQWMEFVAECEKNKAQPFNWTGAIFQGNEIQIMLIIYSLFHIWYANATKIFATFSYSNPLLIFECEQECDWGSHVHWPVFIHAETVFVYISVCLITISFLPFVLFCFFLNFSGLRGSGSV